MKPSMIFAIVMLTAIVMIVSFDLQLSPTTPVSLPNGVDAGTVLYVCPVDSPTWDSISNALRELVKPLTVGFFFAATILMFVWGWALYQNLLKDKFDKASFSKPWGFTKFLFWVGVIMTILITTPNYFRTVHLSNWDGDYVLCDNNTPGAKAVPASRVVR